MNPSSTRFKQRATCPFSEGGDAIEYARVISSPSGVLAFTESHCPGTKPKRETPFTSSSICLVNSESGTERSSRASRVLNCAITRLDDDKPRQDAAAGKPGGAPCSQQASALSLINEEFAARLMMFSGFIAPEILRFRSSQLDRSDFFEVRGHVLIHPTAESNDLRGTMAGQPGRRAIDEDHV